MTVHEPQLPATVVQRLDFSDRRRLFTVGDIHGEFEQFDRCLLWHEFDPQQDAVIMLGDLVDRGPASHLAVEYCQKPGLFRVIGNHEIMATVAGGGHLHAGNGGGWWTQLTHEQKQENIRILPDAPIAIEAITPGGLTCGFVHADVSTDDWSNFTMLLSIGDRHTQADAIWSRARLRMADPTVTGIDHVFMGHSPQRDGPVTRGNCSWIDTGACFSWGELTFVDVDKWVGEARG